MLDLHDSPARPQSVDGFEEARFVQELLAGDLLGKDGMDFQTAWLTFANFSHHPPLERAPLPLPDPASNLLVPSLGPHSSPKHFQ